MPNRPHAIETARLLIELLRRIPRNAKVTANELCEQLASAGYHRNVRSIQRHLKEITEHFDVECDFRSVPYGYRWKEKAPGLTLPGIGPQESLLFTLAEQHLRNFLPHNLTRSLDVYFKQARNNLILDKQAELEKEWLKKVRVVSATQPLLPPPIDRTIFDEVSQALYRNLWLKIVYTNSSGKVIDASVMPLGLAQQGVTLYLVCRFEGYDNERSLALHRFTSAKAGTLRFERPANFCLEQYDNDGRFGYGEGKRIKVTFNIDKMAGKHVLEAKLSEDQHVEETEDSYIITATIVDTFQFDMWINSFGDDVWGVSKQGVDEGA
ncbi:MAG: WYL domain-containing protein [Pseudohongiella sp.]|nr:WYL domain-containing protein [Pseudohongiella sp.]